MSQTDKALPRPLRLALVHRSSEPDWSWVLPKLSFAGQLDVTSVRIPPKRWDASKLQAPASLLAARSVWAAHRREPFDLILSFLPGCAAWVETARLGAKGRHDLFAFNFTDLPTGKRRTYMAKSLRRVNESFVFTAFERELYADVFGLDRERIGLVPWGVEPPKPGRPLGEPAPYIAALGGEARDYAPLMKAARLRPDLRFVVVARPQNLEGLDVPSNMTTLVNVPKEKAWAAVAGAFAHVLPLRSQETPCGIVTAVGAMHLGVPQIVTRAPGVLEYAKEEVSALAIDSGSPEAIVAAIERLETEEGLAERLGRQAAEHAAARLGEDATIRFAERYLRSIAEEPGARIGDEG